MLLAIAGSAGLFAQTQVSGDILVNTTWTLANSPYQVIGPVRVVQAAILTIEPGVEVRFGGQMLLTVDGQLEALGTVSDSIYFLADTLVPDTGFWQGIDINSSLNAFAHLEYCQLAHAATALEMIGNGVGSHLELENSRLSACGNALRAWKPGSATVRRCHFSQNYIAGLDADLEVRRCSFENNTYGFLASVCDIDSSTFSFHAVAAIAHSGGRIANSLFLSNVIGLLEHGGTPLDSVINNQFAENDTALVSGNNLSAVVGNELCANMVNVRLTSGLNLSMGPNCWCSIDSQAIQATLIDGHVLPGLGLLTFLPLDASCTVIGQVWPGDTDDDGVANVADLLYLGVAFGRTGDARGNASPGWVGQAGLPWDQSFASGLNYKHADCDGNGAVNLDDTLAILANYGQTHYKTQRVSGPNGIPLFFDVPASAAAGDTVEINIRLGEAADPAIDVYGLAFTLEFDSTLVRPLTATHTLAGTWLGNPGQDLIDLAVNDGNLSWAIVRTDHQDTVGNGRIGGVSIVMVDDLTRWVQFDSAFSVTTPILVNKNGQSLDIRVQVVPDHSCGPDRFTVCPSPASAQVRIGLDSLIAQEIAVFDHSGKIRYLKSGTLTGSVTVNTAGYQTGIYFVRVRLSNGLLTKKIFILQE